MQEGDQKDSLSKDRGQKADYLEVFVKAIIKFDIIYIIRHFATLHFIRNTGHL